MTVSQIQPGGYGDPLVFIESLPPLGPPAPQPAYVLRGLAGCEEAADQVRPGREAPSPSPHPLRSLLMFYEDWRGVKKLLAKAKLLCDQGGDWERKNKLKVRV